jgi:hypothetical protein
VVGAGVAGAVVGRLAAPAEVGGQEGLGAGEEVPVGLRPGQAAGLPLVRAAPQAVTAAAWWTPAPALMTVRGMLLSLPACTRRLRLT